MKGLYIMIHMNKKFSFVNGSLFKNIKKLCGEYIIVKFKFPNHNQLSLQQDLMISIGRDSDDQFLQVSDTLMSVKNYIDETKYDSDSHRKHTYKQDRLKQIFINAKKNRIKDAFVQKLTRGIDSDDNTMLSLWKEQQTIFKSPIQGLLYREELQNVLQLLNLVVFPILVILTSFCGFLDEFSESYSSHPIMICLQIFCFAVTGFRFVIKCTSMTFSEGEFKRYLKDIAFSYFKTNRLVFDLVMLIFQATFAVFPNRIIPAIFFFYLNLITLYPGNDVTKAESAYIQTKRTALLWGLFKIIYFNVFFAHFMGTVILAMSKIEPQNNWMTRLGIAQQVWYVKYVYAYYWGTTIMMTVGFGDVLPGLHNWRQVIVTSFLEMFSCVVLGYNISAIGSIVSKLREADDVVNRKIIVFQRMMHSNRKKQVKINPLLQRRILNYLQELRIDKGNLEYIERDQFLSSLPENLRRSYYKDANKRIFPKVMFFNRLKQQTLQIMAQKFKSSFYNHGQFLSSNQEVKILILENGKVGLCYNKKGSTLNGQVMETLEVQEGRHSLLLNSKQFLQMFPENKYSLLSKSHCMVWSIRYEQFMETLSKSMIDIQYYFSIIHKHSIDEDQWEFVQCPRCTNGELYKRFHTIFDCSKATKMPIRSFVSYSFAKGAHCQDQIRFNLIRKRSQISRKPAILWKKQFQKDWEKMKSSKAYKKKVTALLNKKQNGHINSKAISEEVAAYGQYIKATQAQSEKVSDQKLRKLILEVLKQHQTGYQDNFWYLECDEAHDYQFYFPQDNINRLWGTPVNVHPRFFHKKQFSNFANKIRTLHQTGISFNKL